MVKNRILVVPASLLLASLIPAGAQTIVNGGFESPIIAGNSFYTPGSSSLTGWDIIGPNGSLVEHNPAGYVGTFPTQALDITGATTSGAGIQQLISGLTPGRSYSICFDVWNFTGFAGDSLRVEMLGSGGQNFAFTPGLQAAVYTFTAGSSSQVLQFQDIAGLDANAWIDNVAFCVPEPGSMSVALLSALGGLVLRRRRE